MQNNLKNPLMNLVQVGMKLQTQIIIFLLVLYTIAVVINYYCDITLAQSSTYLKKSFIVHVKIVSHFLNSKKKTEPPNHHRHPQKSLHQDIIVYVSSFISCLVSSLCSLLLARSVEHFSCALCIRVDGLKKTATDRRWPSVPTFFLFGR